MFGNNSKEAIGNSAAPAAGQSGRNGDYHSRREGSEGGMD